MRKFCPSDRVALVYGNILDRKQKFCFTGLGGILGFKKLPVSLSPENIVRLY